MDQRRDRRRGRPRKEGESGSSVSTWIPDTTHDRLIRLARQHDVSVSAYVKSIVVKHVDKPSS